METGVASGIALIGGVSGGEMILVFLVALVLFGGKKLPGLARQMGKSVEHFRRTVRNVRDEFMNTANEAPESTDAEIHPVDAVEEKAGMEAEPKPVDSGAHGDGEGI